MSHEMQHRRRTSMKVLAVVMLFVTLMIAGAILVFVFENQVQIRRCEMTIWCDQLQVVGHHESEATELIIATGNVKIEYGTRRVTAQRAEYFVTQQRIVLTGNPRAWDTRDRYEMTGEEIIVALPQDHLEVKQARVRFHPQRTLPKGP